MFIVKGIYKGQKVKDYDFLNARGEQVKGTTNKIYVEVSSPNLSPDESLVPIRLASPDSVVSSKVGDSVAFEVSLKGSSLHFVKDVSSK